ncbi:MAG: 16S rRNA (guanine(527)-N(7))-methyltransferase RsmG [Anaerolineae bacterium]|nr:16S rRNA (guanine(527)-N(7))-methyltransferase RsmG [Anaerolineae bacterium]
MTGDVSFLADEASRFHISLSDTQLAQFDAYLALLLAWNERMNLTAVRDPHAIQIRHFLDSLSCATVTGELNGRSLIDIGTGAGFPGLPLKILYPDLQLTLADSVAKKTTFLAAVVAELGLKHVTIVAERAEIMGQQPAHRQHYDWAVARGVVEMRALAEYLLPLCKMGGHMLAQKGESAARETEAAHHAVQTLGGGRAIIQSIQLPEVEMPHYLVVVEKIGETPAAYPRKPGMPGKRPL